MDEEQRAELAAQVREARKARGWSQARLADEAGVAENTVMHLEQAKKNTQPGNVRKILDALEIAPLAATALNLDDVPEDVQIFLRVAVQRLRVLGEGERQAVLTDLYPRLLGSR
jgi:transcriptional regulator with XRE-family HTH domain